MGFQELCLLCYETQWLRHSQVGCVVTKKAGELRKGFLKATLHFVLRSLRFSNGTSPGTTTPRGRTTLGYGSCAGMWLSVPTTGALRMPSTSRRINRGIGMIRFAEIRKYNSKRWLSRWTHNTRLLTIFVLTNERL